MKLRKHRSRFTRGLNAGVLGVGSCALMAAQPALAGDTPPAAVAPGQQGMTVHVDPTTGAVLPAPAPGTAPLTLSPQEQDAMSTSSKGLQEVPVAGPGGGTKIDLRGRFQSPLTATVAPDGTVRIEHPRERSADPHQK